MYCKTSPYRYISVSALSPGSHYVLEKLSSPNVPPWSSPCCLCLRWCTTSCSTAYYHHPIPSLQEPPNRECWTKHVCSRNISVLSSSWRVFCHFFISLCFLMSGCFPFHYHNGSVLNTQTVVWKLTLFSVHRLCCHVFLFLLKLVLLGIFTVNIWNNYQQQSLKITLQCLVLLEAKFSHDVVLFHHNTCNGDHF